MAEATNKKRSKKKTPRVLIDVSSYPKDEKGHAIVPDDFFDEHLKELPDMTKSQNGRIAHYGGVLIPLGADPNRDKEIHKAGGEALQAKLKQRQSFSDMFDVLLRKKDENGITYQEKIALAMMDKASTGDTKAAVFVRDTSGEMPVSKQMITADVTTEADRALMEKLSRRLQEDAKKGES